ncbi:RDD family protein [Flavobacterium sp. FlaQc-28]|uniref:RDD family protein n=1 Tax=Flavobacterium sp. FlaQc-28 TaxID=3374178 RepID=UPI0037572832
MKPTYLFKRVFAFGIDFIILALTVKILFPYISYKNSSGESYIKTEIGLLIYYLFFILQDVFMSKTIGKYIFKLQMTFDHPMEIKGYKRYFRIIIRRIFDLLELVCPFLYLITIVLTKKNQKLGDLIAKIVVTQKPNN